MWCFESFILLPNFNVFYYIDGSLVSDFFSHYFLILRILPHTTSKNLQRSWSLSLIFQIAEKNL